MEKYSQPVRKVQKGFRVNQHGKHTRYWVEYELRFAVPADQCKTATVYGDEHDSMPCWGTVRTRSTSYPYTTVGFFTADEKSSLLSGWGSLSAGSHPGVPEREQARIGLVVALEFGQLLMWKFCKLEDQCVSRVFVS
jgi:hypothetical protein